MRKRISKSMLLLICASALALTLSGCQKSGTQNNNNMGNNMSPSPTMGNMDHSTMNMSPTPKATAK